MLWINTRPKAWQEARVQSIRQNGDEVFHLPLVRLQAIEHTLAEKIITADALVFISPSAVEFAAKSAINWKSYTHLTAIAVGESTAQKVQQLLGLTAIYPPNSADGDAVAQMPFWNEHRGKVLIVGGQGGREDWWKNLTLWQVEKIMLYCRIEQIPTLSDWQHLAHLAQNHSTIALWLTSSSMARTWLKVNPSFLTPKKLLYFALHPYIVEILHQAGLKNVYLCTREDALFKMIERLG